MARSDTPSPSDTPTTSEAELSERLLGKLKIDIPGYELLDEIARGGQATVYRARELTSGLTVAIKLLHAGPHANEASRQRLAREIAALKALNHPNIVCVIEAGQTGTGLDFLVMNYIDGRGLDEFWRDRKTLEAEADDPAKLLKLFQQICETMAAAHRKGITHRDLSPSNIRIDENGIAHILDFGLASTAFDGYLTPGGGELSITGQFIGKLAYASPEQAKGDRGQIDIRTDVYALGVILYQILTHGAFPYAVVGNLVDVLNNIIHSKPMPPSQLLDQAKAAKVSAAVKLRKHKTDPAAINATIEAIVLKALEKDPANRYQSAGELAREIEQYLRGKPLSAAPLKVVIIRKRAWPKYAAAVGGVLILAGAFMYGRTIAAMLGFSSLLSAAPTSQPSTQPAEAPGRIEFKTIELASTETSIDAINKSLKAAGYAVVVANNHASQYDQGNIDMNRNGGGPVDWRSFYGKTVKDFSSTNVFGNRQTYRRPPQFNYIYQANSQEKTKLEKDVNSLGKQIDTLLTRRRQLEQNQLSLWATIAWQAVDDRGIALEQIYRFKPQSKASDAASTARLNAFAAASAFVVAINGGLESGLDSVSDDPIKTLATLNDTTKNAYAKFRASMADVSASGDDQQTVGQFAETAKHLYDLTRNAVDAQKLASERDQAKDDQGKNTFRGQLQAAMFDTCTAVCSLDDQLNAAAKTWELTPDNSRPITTASPNTSNGPGSVSASPALLISGSRWVDAPGDRFSKPNRSCRLEATVENVDGSDVILHVNAVDDTRPNKVWQQTIWHLQTAGDGSIQCKQINLSSKDAPGWSGVNYTGRLENGLLTLKGGWIDRDNKPDNQILILKPELLSTDVIQPGGSAATTLAALPRGSNWTHTSANTFDSSRDDAAVHASVAAVDNRDVTLLVVSNFGKHSFKLHVADDGSISCDHIDNSEDATGPSIADVHLSGQLSSGVLKLQGTLTRKNTRRGWSSTATETLALQADSHTDAATPPADGNASTLSVGTHWKGTFTGWRGNIFPATAQVISAAGGIAELEVTMGSAVNRFSIKSDQNALTVVGVKTMKDPQNEEWKDADIHGTADASAVHLIGTITRKTVVHGNFAADLTIDNQP